MGTQDDNGQTEPRTEIDAALDAALARLPRHTAPAPLQRRVRAQVLGPAAPVRRRAWGWAAPLVSACAAAALVVVVMRFAPAPGGGRGGGGGSGSGSPSALVTEAVNDHIRVVSSTHPVDIESGGIHQVKPWFTGRLEFAPRVTFSGDDDFPLVGGGIGYFVDRKAAMFLFKRRLHVITLLVFPADGLPWSGGPGTPVGPLSVDEQTSRGFNVLLWQESGLGYALTSDVNRRDLEVLAARINREP
jgi:anti-sigma factor RsiW